MSTAADTVESKKSALRNLLIFLAPILLLLVVIGAFIFTNGAGLNVRPVAPIETVQFERTILRPGEIELHLRNTSPQAIRIAQININDALWPFAIRPSNTIPRLGSAVITVNYHWVEGESYAITLLSGSSIPFVTSVPVAAVTPGISTHTLWSFTLIGVYVGVIPILLGMFWLPALKSVGQRSMVFLLSATVGLLIYLGIDATAEALESGSTLGGALQGPGLIGIGIVSTVLLLDALNRRQRNLEATQAGQHMALATMVAVGIGLHNLGEGLAIGAAYAIGAAALGTFLVVGFILQNITEGLGIIVPISHDQPKLSALALLGVIGGGPAIVGTWVGGLVYSQPLSVLFLAIGAGAVFQVSYEIGKELIWKDAQRRAMPLTVFSGVLAGMLVLYVTGLAIK